MGGEVEVGPLVGHVAGAQGMQHRVVVVHGCGHIARGVDKPGHERSAPQLFSSRVRRIPKGLHEADVQTHEVALGTFAFVQLGHDGLGQVHVAALDLGSSGIRVLLGPKPHLKHERRFGQHGILLHPANASRAQPRRPARDGAFRGPVSGRAAAPSTGNLTACRIGISSWRASIIQAKSS